MGEFILKNIDIQIRKDICKQTTLIRIFRVSIFYYLKTLWAVIACLFVVLTWNFWQLCILIVFPSVSILIACYRYI